MKINHIKRVSLLLVLFSAACAGGVTTKETRSPESDALLRAARAGHADTVKTTLAAPGADVNVRDENGSTPLIEAARGGHDDVVQALLVARADVKVKDNRGKTALMYASEGGHNEIVKLLRQAGAAE